MPGGRVSQPAANAKKRRGHRKREDRRLWPGMKPPDRLFYQFGVKHVQEGVV